MNPSSRIYVAGHRGLVGSGLVRELQRRGCGNLVLRTHAELDLTDRRAVEQFFRAEKPEYVFVAAAKVGGIFANNTFPADFIRDNLEIQTNVVHQAWASSARRLIFFGSSCIYPRDCPQPIREEYLLTGPLEHTNSAYALAKIAGIEMCRAYNQQHGAQFLTVMPTNLYGPGDNYDPQNAHVLPALIRRIHEAKTRGDRDVVIWGSGTPRREFLHVDDLAAACVMLASLDDAAYAAQIGAWRYPLLNIGCGADQTVTELAMTIAGAIGFRGGLRYDATKPDGTPQKLLDISRISALGWRARIGLREGIARTYRELLEAGTLPTPRSS
jgi:GDP-L-fucose synthase